MNANLLTGAWRSLKPGGQSGRRHMPYAIVETAPVMSPGALSFFQL
jgi:hypothetical protein